MQSSCRDILTGLDNHELDSRLCQPDSQPHNTTLSSKSKARDILKVMRESPPGNLTAVVVRKLGPLQDVQILDIRSFVPTPHAKRALGSPQEVETHHL